MINAAPRRAWLLLHRWAGLGMALFLVVAGLTGSVIAYQHELDRFLNPHLLVVQPRGAPLPPTELRKLAEQQVAGGHVDFLNLKRGADESAAFMVSGAAPGFNTVYLDPYSGRYLGAREVGAMRLDREHIIGFLYELHYTMALPEPWGRWLFGVVALVWTLDCFVGLYLALPRGRHRRLVRWRPAWMVKWTASAQRINFDLHRAAALWTWLMLLVLAVSSVQLNLDRELFGPAFRAVFPVNDVRAQLAAVPPPGDRPLMPWDDALARGRELIAAHARADGFSVAEETSMALSRPRGIFRYRVRSSLDIDGRYGRTIVYFSAIDGQELAFEHPRIAAGNLVLRWLVMLHFGHVWGAPFQAFVCVMGIVTALLSLTGVLIWWRRRAARRE